MNRTTAELVEPHLPSLRRFSYALSGEKGDANLAALLELLIASQGALRRDLAPRKAVFQLFIELWSAASAKEPLAQSKDAGVVETRIAAVGGRARQAFLLAALEDFSERDIAVVLRTEVEEVRRLLDIASSQIFEQIAAKILLLEEDALLTLDMERLVEEMGHKVAGAAANEWEAVILAKRAKPDLVLMDVSPGGENSAIEAAIEILDTLKVPIIVITEKPERVADSRLHPAFIMQKPFEPRDLEAMINQSLFFEMSASVRPGAASPALRRNSVRRARAQRQPQFCAAPRFSS